MASRKGYVLTMLGRRRYLPDASSSVGKAKGHALRAAINTPIQGSAADVATAAMLAIHNCPRLHALGWKLLLQVCLFAYNLLELQQNESGSRLIRCFQPQQLLAYCIHESSLRLSKMNGSCMVCRYIHHVIRQIHISELVGKGLLTLWSNEQGFESFLSCIAGA